MKSFPLSQDIKKVYYWYILILLFFKGADMNKWYLSLLTVFFISGSVYAANETTSSIRGDVNVSGATIEITHTPTGASKTVVAGDDGTFAVSNLRPGGPYIIKVTASGYTPERLTGVYLNVSQTSNVDINLSGGSMDEVVVSGSKTSFTKFGSGLSISAADIEGTPSIERSISEYVKKDSRIIVNGQARNASISVSGTNNRYNNFTVDGVAQNDPLGLNANGFPSVRNPISIETLEQISVDISPFDVSKGNFTGASINAVTKSGTNEFKGMGYYYSTDENNVGDLNGSAPSQFEDETTGFVLGGPIIKDKLFFFTAYEEFESLTPSEEVVYRIADQALIDRITNITKTLYNYDPGSPNFSPPPEMAEKQLTKIDYIVNDKNRLEYVYSYSEDNSVKPYNYDIRFSSHYYNYPTTNEKSTYSWYGDLTDNFYVQAKFSDVEYTNDQDALGGEDFPHVEIRITDSMGGYTSGSRESIFLGGDKYRSANETSATDEILNIKGVLTIGDHEITMGYDSIDKFVSNLFISREDGAYQFQGVDNFEAGVPSFFRFNQSATGDPYDAAAAFSGTFKTIYIQDKMYVSDILTVLAGLRLDSFAMNNGPMYNELASQKHGFSNSTPAKSRIIQPRVGFNLDATDLMFSNSSKVVSAELRGGIGLFAGRVPNVWLASPFSNSGVATYGARYYSPCPVAGDPTCFYGDSDLYTLIPPGSVSPGGAEAIDPNYETPSTWKTSVELDLTTANGYNLRLAYNRDDAKEGMGFYDSTHTVDQSSPTGIVSYNGYGHTVISNAEGTSSESMSFGFDKDFDNGTSVFVSYTNMKASSGWSATSSQASSNLRYQLNADIKNVPVAPTNWSNEHRLVMGLDKTMNIFDGAPTKISLFYKAYSGSPYSHTLDGFDNGLDDGSTLMYVPTAGDANVVYDGVTENDVLAAITKAGLNSWAGRVIPRNHHNLPWTKQLDMRIAQEVPTFVDGHKLFVYLDVLNLMNLIDEDKGHQKYYNYGSRGLLESDGFNSSGQIIITGIDDRGPSTDTYGSRYRMQLGFAYKF